jgi:hypothetical protein
MKKIKNMMYKAVPYESGRILGQNPVFFSESCPEKKSCRSGVRNPGRKKFLPGFFGHPGRNFLPGCREKRSCQIVTERPKGVYVCAFQQHTDPTTQPSVGR